MKFRLFLLFFSLSACIQTGSYSEKSKVFFNSKGLAYIFNNEDYEKIRYLRQYTHLLAVYAEHEPYKVESVLSKLPNVFQEEVWDLYIQENDVFEYDPSDD